MNDKLPLPDSYKSEFLQKVRQQEHCSYGTSYNIVIAPSDKASEKLPAIARKPISLQSSSSTNREPSVISLTKAKVKKCLFSRTQLRENQFRFIKPFQLAMHQGNKKNSKNKYAEKEPNDVGTSAYRYMSLDIGNQEDSNKDLSANTLRFLIHNTCAYSVRSLLCFVQERDVSVREYHSTKLCKEVFGEVSLPFLEDVYRHRVTLMSYYRRLGIYPKVVGNRRKICMACEKTGEKCKCPELDSSFYLFCRQSCPTGFDCKCKNWTVPPHVCLDFFFCKTCDQYYESTKLKSYPSYCC